jgi:hypothetical protein
LARIAWRPLTPRLVAEVLKISGQERVRWTKDGRLPTSGRELVQQRQLIAVPIYAVELIASLAAQPETLTAWRLRDADARSSS